MGPRFVFFLALHNIQITQSTSRMSQLDINEYFTDNRQRNTFFFHNKLQRLVPLNHILSTSGNRISPNFTIVQQKSAETQLPSVYLTTRAVQPRSTRAPARAEQTESQSPGKSELTVCRMNHTGGRKWSADGVWRWRSEGSRLWDGSIMCSGGGGGAAGLRLLTGGLV